MDDKHSGIEFQYKFDIFLRFPYVKVIYNLYDQIFYNSKEFLLAYEELRAIVAQPIPFNLTYLKKIKIYSENGITFSCYMCIINCHVTVATLIWVAHDINVQKSQNDGGVA